MFDSAGSQLNDMSTATGISVENLSFLKYAAEQSSTSIESIAKAAKFMQKNGIDPNQFEKIASSIAKITDPTQRAQAAMAQFGSRGGATLLPMIDSLAELRQRFEQLGGGFTEAMAKRADALGDSMGDLKLVLGNLSMVLADQLAPAVMRITNFIAENSQSIRKWIEEHGTLVKAIGLVAFTLTTVTPILWTINTVVTTLTASIKGLTTAAMLAGNVPMLSKLLKVAGPLGTAGALVGAGALAVGAGHAAVNTNVGNWSGSTGVSRSWDAETGKNTKQQVDEQRKTNALLQTMVHQKPIEIKTAGVR